MCGCRSRHCSYFVRITYYVLLFGTLQSLICSFPQSVPQNHDKKAGKTGAPEDQGSNTKGHLEEQESHPPGCPGCKDTKEYKLQYLEKIKWEILSKLNKNKRPRQKFQTSSIPAPLYEGNLLDEDPRGLKSDSDGFHGQTKQIIIMGKRDPIRCKKKNCFYFRLSKKVFRDPGQVTSLELWVNKLRNTQGSSENVIKVVQEVSQRFQKKGKSAKVLLVSKMDPRSSDWLAIEVLKTKEWMTMLDPSKAQDQQSEYLDVFLRIVCSGCVIAGDRDKRPFLVVNTNSNSKVRKRRTLECGATVTECCRAPLLVNFSSPEFKWNDWIIQPKSYQANYCKGTCNSSGLTVPIYGHSSVVQRAKPKIKTCCTPKKFSSINLLYYDDDGMIYKKMVPNMVVEECGCA